MSKKEQIKAGKYFTDGKGCVRYVIDTGPQYALINSQEDLDCVRFQVVAKKRGPHLVGSEHNCTRTSFAAWMKSECQWP